MSISNTNHWYARSSTKAQQQLRLWIQWHRIKPTLNKHQLKATRKRFATQPQRQLMPQEEEEERACYVGAIGVDH